MTETFTKIPTIRIWNLVLVPLQGEIGDDLAAQMTYDVLQEIHGAETHGLIIDVTGLWLIDSHMCAVLSQLAAASSLMGVKTYLCGLSAEIAATLQSMDLSLPGVETMSTLEQAFEALGALPPQQYLEAEELRTQTTDGALFGDLLGNGSAGRELGSSAPPRGALTR